MAQLGKVGEAPRIPLIPGDEITNGKLVRIFQCSSQGGMRRSLKTGTLVVVSNHVSSIYGDRWEKDVLYYTGMGQTGDQSLKGNQNKTLYESRTNGVEVHLFEVFKNGRYTYAGEVELGVPPYEERQPDVNHNMRNTWIFPLVLKSGNGPKAVSLEDFRGVQKTHIKRVSKYSDSQLFALLPAEGNKPSKRITQSYEYSRDPHVVTAALRRAMGVCQLCNGPAPFVKKDGTPFLEVHHIQPLAEDGEDSLTNCVALCPNCHRKVHALKEPADLKKLVFAASNHWAYTSIECS
jgi:5-methylcytosine-specific restriction enzyme A